MISITRSAESKAAVLAKAQASARARIDESITAARRLYITTLPGQEMIYQAKENEAKAYLVLDPEPADLDEFPMLAAEVGVTAPTAYELAQIWLNMAAQWRAVAADLENLRLTAREEIDNATTVAELDQIVADRLT